jgi:uncharacterized SAM-binding protein YcdF (DUF218 family)
MSYLEPALPLCLAVGLIGLIYAWRRSKKGQRPWLLTLSITGIFLLSLNAMAWVLSLPLEIWYDRNSVIPGETAEAIVILSGAVDPPRPNRPYPFVGSDTYRRLRHGVWLFKNWNSLPILVCGGRLNEGDPFAKEMRRVLESEGIPPDSIWTEGRSRSTHENAVHGSEILRLHGVSRVALVVEANSMLRAAASFERAGIQVVPAPIRFTTLRGEFTDVLPSWQAIALNGEALHELLGLLWYRLRGWI